MIEITNAARDKILQFMEKESEEHGNPVPPYTAVFRAAVKGGGCSGLSYSLGVETADETELQKAHLINEIYVVIDPKSALYLAGAEIDYIEGLMASGFKITNPNASRTCGCGSSFA